MNPIRYMAARPFLSSLIVLLLIAVPGYWRLDTIASESHTTASTTRSVVERVEAQAEIDAMRQCQTRNTAQRSTRETFMVLFDRLEELGRSNPATIRELRDALPRPAEADADCDSDGRLDEDDYAE